MSGSRIDGRGANSIRPLAIIASSNPYADGSAEVSFGNTKLLISALLQENGSGTVNVSLSMLPCSTRLRVTDATLSLPKEIEFIETIVSHTLASSLASANVDSLDLELYVSVCVADGGVAAAAVAGGWVAMYQVLSEAAAKGVLKDDLDLPRVAAISAGIVDNEMRLDLLSEETTQASYHHVVSTSVTGGIISVHSESKGVPATNEKLSELTELCLSRVEEIFAAQAKAVS